MFTLGRSLAGLLVVACLMSGSLAEDNEIVGGFGDFSRLEISGLVSFTAEEIRDELRDDFDALLAAHPLAPLSDLPVAIRERLVAGFLNEGFAEAEVEVRLDRDQQRLQAVVREGPRYVAGSVRVEGAAQIPVDRLIERLTKPYPPREAVKLAFGPGDGEHVQWKDRDGKDVELKAPVWKHGDTARLAPVSKEWMARKVKFALEDQGFRFAKFQIDMESDSKTQTADLVVHLEAEGPKASLDEIEIVGNKRDSKEAILKYLNLNEGSLLTRAEQTRVEYELWRSGRFIDYELTPAPPDAVDDPVKLQIKVTESPYAPPIDQPLSREEQVLLKMREWLANPDRWQGDMTLRVKPGDWTFELVLTPGGGVLATFSPQSEEPHRAFAVVASKDVVGFYPATAPVKLEALSAPVQLEAKIGVGLNADPGDPPKHFKLSFGFSIHNGRSSDLKCPFTGSINMQPAVAVANVHAHNAKVQWDGGTLTLLSDRGRMQVDEASGALLSYRDKGNRDAIEITFRKGAFDRRLQDIRERTGELENGFDPDRPLSSFLAFFCREEVIAELVDEVVARVYESKKSDEEMETIKNQLKTLTLARKLLDAGVLQPIDDLYTEPESQKDAEFDVPTNISPSDKQLNLAAIYARVAVTMADELFPRNSWLWTVWREAGFTVAGKGKYTGPQLQVLYESRDFGPACYLALGALLERVQPRMSQLFASRGLWSTDAADFRKDYEPLMDRQYVVGACLLQASKLIRELDAEEIRGIVDRLPDEYGACLQAFANELQSDDSRATEQAIPAALDRCWDAGLKQVVESQLRGLRDRNSVRVGLR